MIAHRRRSRSVELAALVGGLLGCSSSTPISPQDAGPAAALDGGRVSLDDGGTCAWGATLSCACDGGATGVAHCLSSGALGPCLCLAVRPDGATLGDAALSVDGAPSPDAAPPDTRPAYEETRSLAISARHLVADVARGRLYATVGGTAANNPNSLVVIDPRQPSIIKAVPVGSEPGVMALSDDGSTLWVGIDGAYAIRRIDLRTDPPTPGAMYPLPPSAPFSDPITVVSMVVLPGAPGSVLLTGGRGGNSGGLLLLDDGKPRGMGSSSYYYDVSRVTIGPAGYAFASAYSFMVVKINATGFTTTAQSSSLVASGDELVYAGGRLFGRSGVVVDVSNPDRPVRAGQFGYTGLLVPTAKANRVAMLSAGDAYPATEPTLRILDTERFVQSESVPIKSLTTRRFGDLVSAGPDSVAFLEMPDIYSTPGTSEGRLHVLSSALLRDLP
jgi:hypothetical protein